MEARIKEAFPGTTVELIEGGGGIYDVRADGRLVFSKHGVGRHAEWDEVREALAEIG